MTETKNASKNTLTKAIAWQLLHERFLQTNAENVDYMRRNVSEPSPSS